MPARIPAAAESGVRTRRLQLADAVPLTRLLTADRDYLAPWNPERDDDFFTIETQTEIIRTAQAEEAAGRSVSLVIVDQYDEVLGQVHLNSIIRGAFQSASIGYWVSASHTRRGVATAAVADALRIAFDDLKIAGRWQDHRLFQRLSDG